jgi:hypothetical protein
MRWGGEKLHGDDLQSFTGISHKTICLILKIVTIRIYNRFF